MKELLERLSALSTVELDGEAKRANRSRAGAEWELAAALQAMQEDDRFRELGYASVLSYAEGELRLSERKAIELLRVARMAKEFPSVGEAFGRGEVSYCKLREIIRVISPVTAEGWISYARTHTTRDVERAVVKSPRALRKQAPTSVSAAKQASNNTMKSQAPATAVTESKKPERDAQTQEGLPFVEGAGDDAPVFCKPSAESSRPNGGQMTVEQPGLVAGPTGCDQTVADGNMRPENEDTDATKTSPVDDTSPTEDAPPPGPILVRLTFTLTAEQYAIYQAAEDQVKAKLHKRATREEVLTYLAGQKLAKADSRTRARYPIVVQTEDGRTYYHTRRGDLPADLERLQSTLSQSEVASSTKGGEQPISSGKRVEKRSRRAHKPTGKTMRRSSMNEPPVSTEKSSAIPDCEKPSTTPSAKTAPEQPTHTHTATVKQQWASQSKAPGLRATIVRRRREIPTSVVKAVMARARYQCEECGSRDLLELDHVTAVIDGGDNSADNLRVKCRRCHRARHKVDFLTDPRYQIGLDYAEARMEARLEAEDEARLLQW